MSNNELGSLMFMVNIEVNIHYLYNGELGSIVFMVNIEVNIVNIK